ncbi:MAG: hypothetical protein AB1511_06835 [Deinococcota bacterium]
MALRVTRLSFAARTGSWVVRSLVRPAWRMVWRRLAPWPRDPWAPLTVRKPAPRPDLGRVLGLTTLVLQSVLGFLLVVPLLVVLGIGTALGVHVAAWLLGVTLLLALLGLIRNVIRGARLLSAAPAPAAVLSGEARPLSRDEDELLALLRSGERALPASARSALHATVIATRDALRCTAGDAALGRDAFDARQAAREDLPELLRTYHAAPRTPETDRLFLGQLALIERRMRGITRERQQQQARALEAQRRYLESKYGEREEEPVRR